MEVEVYIEETINKPLIVDFIKKEPIDLDYEEDFIEAVQPSKKQCTSNVSIQDVFKEQEMVQIETRFECKKCHIEFASEYSYNKHQKSHMKKKKYLCRDCGQAFKQLIEIKEHLKIHAIEKPFKCRPCGLRFSSHSLLSSHAKTHNKELNRGYRVINPQTGNESTLDCQIEGIAIKRENTETSYDNRYDIASGLQLTEFEKNNSETIEIPGGLTLHKCIHCDAHFIETEKLVEHLETVHNKKEAFPCKYCKEEFYSKNLCQQHEKIHEENTGFYILPKTEVAEDDGVTFFATPSQDDNILEDSVESSKLPHIPTILDEPVFKEVLGKNKIYRTLTTTQKPCYIILPKNIAEKKGIMSRNPDIKEVTPSLLVSQAYNLSEEISTLYKKLSNKDDDDTQIEPEQIVTTSCGFQVKEHEVNSAVQNIQSENTTIIDQDGNVHYQDMSTVHQTVYTTETYEDDGKTSNNSEIITTTVISQPYSFICNYCKNFFQTNCDLMEHLKVHDAERPYPCDFCGRWFKTNALLHEHLNTHTEDRPYSCEICQRTFAKTSQLKYHMEHKHFGDQKTATRYDPDNTNEFYCNICDKLYLDSTYKKAHMAEHSNLFNVICHQCGQTFKDVATIQRHLPVHLHETEQKLSKAPPKLNPIIKCFELNKSPKKTEKKIYSCYACDRFFSNKSNLIIHEKMHSDRRFKCRLCNLTFNQSVDLKDHMKNHVANIPYSCSLCYQGFHTIEACKSHVKKNHLGNAQIITKCSNK